MTTEREQLLDMIAHLAIQNSIDLARERSDSDSFAELLIEYATDAAFDPSHSIETRAAIKAAIVARIAAV